MTRRPAELVAWTAAVIGAAMLVTACGGSKPKPVSQSSASPAASTSALPTPTPTPTPTLPPPPPPVYPLTGAAALSATPVIAVKIDDTDAGRPQKNIDLADIVYIEQAEGGLSRLVAIFGTNKPVVGYVRSTRPSDPELLLQYGKITLAASGGGGDSLPLLDASGIKGWINDRGAPFYARQSHYNDHGYVNLTLDLAKVAAQSGTPAAQNIGFTWSAAAPAAPSGPGALLQTAVGSTPVQFRWDAALAKYVRYIDGIAQKSSDGAPVATPNVIVMQCQITPHYGDVDVNGNPAQFTTTVGTGAASVFRNGVRVDGTWTRPSPEAGTTFTDAAGQVIPLAPGGAWVALVGTATPVTVG